MKRAHLRDAAHTQKFHFRQHIAPPPEDAAPLPAAPTGSVSTGASPMKDAEGKVMSNTEKEIAAAIAGINTPCGPCSAKVSLL